MLLTSNPVIGHTFVISKKLLMDFNGISERISFPMHDWELLFFAINNEYSIHYVDLELSYYRIHADNIVGIGSKNIVMKTKRFIQFINKLAVLNTLYFNNNFGKFIMSSLRRIMTAIRVSPKRFILELILLLSMILLYWKKKDKKFDNIY